MRILGVHCLDMPSTLHQHLGISHTPTRISENSSSLIRETINDFYTHTPLLTTLDALRTPNLTTGNDLSSLVWKPQIRGAPAG